MLAALALATLGAGSAAADTTAVADPTAQNVTAYGTTAAWSRKAADGYHLVVAQGATVVDAPVPASPTPYDPDLGPTSANGRAIVYARDGDLYRYDVGAAAEQKLTALSSSATEIAPSFFKDRIVFSRTNGKRPGTYILRPKRKLTRLFKTMALETDVAETRVIGRYGTGDEVDHPDHEHDRRRREDRRPREDRAARDQPDAHALQRHLAARRPRPRRRSSRSASTPTAASSRSSPSARCPARSARWPATGSRRCTRTRPACRTSRRS